MRRQPALEIHSFPDVSRALEKVGKWKGKNNPPGSGTDAMDTTVWRKLSNGPMLCDTDLSIGKQNFPHKWEWEEHSHKQIRQ